MKSIYVALSAVLCLILALCLGKFITKVEKKVTKKEQQVQNLERDILLDLKYHIPNFTKDNGFIKFADLLRIFELSIKFGK